MAAGLHLAIQLTVMKVVQDLVAHRMVKVGVL
jgi:hypothetical protein